MEIATRVGRAVACTAVVAGLLGCGPSPVRRTNPDACVYGESLCKTNMREEAGYGLNFVQVNEFGQYAVDGQFQRAMAHIKEAQSAHAKNLVVVFVHGWFHSDDATDRDVNRAREALKDFSKYNPGWHVEGIYVGWPAWTHLGPPLQYTTFWSRAHRADNLGHGALGQMVEKLDDAVPNTDTSKLLLIGHSFGGRAMFIATAPLFEAHLEEALIAWHDIGTTTVPVRNTQHAVRGVGSLVVLFEPAITADAWVPLYNAANRAYIETEHPPADRQRIFKYNDRPLLLAFTSDADFAVNAGVPLSALLSSSHPGETTVDPWVTNMKPYRVATQSLYNHSMGLALSTHNIDIDIDGDVDSGCSNAPTMRYGGVDEPPPFKTVPAHQLPRGWLQCAVHEQSVHKTESGSQFDHLVLPYSCADIVHKGHSSPFSPYWNATTNENVIQGHSAFMNRSVLFLLNQMAMSAPYDNSKKETSCQYAGKEPNWDTPATQAPTE